MKHNKGFSLIELLVVLAILGLFVAMMTQVFTRGDDQRRFDETRARMQEIKKAILGSEGAYAYGQRQFAGYVADMGGLPALDDMGTPADLTDDQPKVLWEQETLPDWEYKDTPKTWMGWRGPYLETPPGDILKDGWGNPFVFDNTSPADLTIVSYGADGLDESDENAGSGLFDDDITITIRQTEYMAPVAGRVEGFGNFNNVIVQLYYPLEGDVAFFRIGVDSEGYFRFEHGLGNDLDGKTLTDIPVGLRSIVVSEPPDSKRYIFTIEPTGNWLGDIEIQ